MKNYLPPLSVIFVWHPADTSKVKPIVDHCSSLLSRDIEQPFSRAMNLPIFYRTTTKKGVPSKIEPISEKTVIFPFISKEVMADDDDWMSYFDNIPKSDNVYLIPIALDENALKARGIFEKRNFIRAYEFEKLYINDYMFISVAHEIYRWALNEVFDDKGLGKDNAIKIFLSHAKDGRNGIKLAKALKDFIDNSTMRNFFDATDIAPSYKFDDEIVGHLKQSTLVAIHSDSYSSRYWCQREILSAKEHNCPIIAVDGIAEYEDRRFPFASNVPSVYVHFHDTPDKKDLLRILSSTLLETIRFCYSTLLLKQFKQAGWINSKATIISRPPEVADIEKVLAYNGRSIGRKHKTIIYPEPPVYSEELSFLTGLGIQLDTPLTCNVCSLQDKRIGISISNPGVEELTNMGQDDTHLIRVSQDLARHLLTRCATLVYGGDLREDGFTEFIFNEALALQTRLQTEDIHLRNYIAWPIYKNDSIDVKSWKATYKYIAEMIELPPVADVRDLIPSEDVFLPPINLENSFVWSRCLTEMRKQMIEFCDIRICAGGRHSGYKGKMPGVLEEILIALERKRPIFLLGGFGGVTASVCQIIKDGVIPQELNLDWQIQNNSGYKELLDFCKMRDHQYSTDYNSITERLKNAELYNGLSKDDNIKLCNTQFIEEALHLIFKGLKSLYA